LLCFWLAPACSSKDTGASGAGTNAASVKALDLTFPDGKCAFDCEWWCGPNEGDEVDGTCENNQHCCMKPDAMPKVQCAHTCIKEWETCEGTVIPEDEGSCSDVQSVCCDLGEDDTETGSVAEVFPDGSCAYNCEWWCGPNEGIEVDGTCEGNQHCCMNDEPAKVQCAHTCIKEWETCEGAVVPEAEGSCSDVQGVCCDTGISVDTESDADAGTPDTDADAGDTDTVDTDTGPVVFPDGSCAYNCEWWCGPNEGVEVEGTCAGNQHCCMNDEPPKVPCAHTCVMEWETCDGTIVPESEGSCSDLQARCCDMGEDDTDTETEPGTVVFPDGKCAYSCEWWCGPAQGVDVEGTCAGNQHCCMNVAEPPKVQCAHTCVMEWETCDGTVVPEEEGSCSDLQARCCDTGESDTETGDTETETEPETVVFPDGKCAYNCEWWCGPAQGADVEGTCAGNQHCCMNEEPPKVQCAYTCIKEWESCNGTIIPEAEGSCSDLQAKCCQENLPPVV